MINSSTVIEKNSVGAEELSVKRTVDGGCVRMDIGFGDDSEFGSWRDTLVPDSVYKNFLNLQDGNEHIFKIVGNVEETEVHFLNGKRILCKGGRCEYCHMKPPTTRFSTEVINFANDERQVLEVGAIVFGQIKEIVTYNMACGVKPSDYWVKIVRSGKGIDSRYTVTKLDEEPSVEECDKLPWD